MRLNPNTPLLRSILAGAILFGFVSVADAQKKRIGKFTIGKATTYVEGPLDKEGYIDYLSALNEELRKGIKPEENAFVVLCKAIGPHPEGSNLAPPFFKWLEIDPLPEKGDYFIRTREFAKISLKLESNEEREEFEDRVKEASERPWKADEFPQVAAWLKINEKPLALIAEAHKRPRYYHPLVMSASSPPNTSMIGASQASVQICREIARAFTARAMLHCGQKEGGVWDDLIACHRLGALIGRGATSIEMLVGIAVQSAACRGGLAWLHDGQPPVEQIEKAIADLQKIAPFDIAAKVDLAERFVVLETVMLSDREGFEALAKKKEEDPRAFRVLEEMNWDSALSATNSWFDRWASALRETDRSIRKLRLEGIDAKIETLSLERRILKLERRTATREDAQSRNSHISHFLIPMLFSSHSRAAGAAEWATQERTNLIVACALEIYRRDNRSYPKNLTSLAPKYLKEVPSDLFTGKDLIYRPSETGYLLYSLGVNEKDDNGRGRTDTPAGDDLSVRMPLVELQKK